MVNPTTQRAAQRVGMLLKGRWRLDSLIGVGGMAAVYAATHRNGSRVAIKVLNPEFAAQPEFVARFMREGYVANKIEHPASVRVVDDDNEDGVAFLVMELLSGHSLERYARRGQGRLPLVQVMRIGDQVLDLLAVAHRNGILHRDIKPANIHMTATGEVKVLDFGIARLAEQAGDAVATVTGAALGTPAYMPPEQARGRWTQVDPRTDLWALGATLHALILGDRPRRAETVQEEMLLAMTAPLHPLRVAMPSTPPQLLAFIEKATAFEMDGRFTDAPSMQAALRQVSASLNLPSMPPAALGVGAAIDGPHPATGGGGSGPKVDTAPMVFGGHGGTGGGTGGAGPGTGGTGAGPGTLHATESSHAAPPPKSRLLMAASVFVVTLVVGVAVGAKLILPSHPVASAGPSAPPSSVADAAAASPPPVAPPPKAPDSSACRDRNPVRDPRDASCRGDEALRARRARPCSDPSPPPPEAGPLRPGSHPSQPLRRALLTHRAPLPRFESAVRSVHHGSRAGLRGSSGVRCGRPGHARPG